MVDILKDKKLITWNLVKARPAFITNIKASTFSVHELCNVSIMMINCSHNTMMVNYLDR